MASKWFTRKCWPQAFGDKPLDVVAQGPGDVYEGSIWVANYGSKTITILEPVMENDWEFEVASDNSTPVARHEAAFVEAGGKFYLIGGRGNNPVNIYDPITQLWTSGATPPMEMHHFQAVYYDGLIYVINAFTGGFPNETPIANIYTYDPVLDQWNQGSLIPAARQRGSSGVVIYQNKFYVVSGIQNGHTDGWVPWMDLYDPVADSWTTLPDAPRERDHFHAAEIEGKLYLAGGRRSGFGGSTFAATVAEVDVFDIATSMWSTLPASANIPTERAGNTVAVVNGQLLVIGGESSSQNIAHNETEILDPKTSRWGTLSPLNTGRHGTQAIMYQGKIYVTAGSGSRGGSPELNTTEVLTATLICSGDNTNYTLDDDLDGYSNGDETDNGSNPCSGASQPDDNDDDLVSDLNDDDDDNDTILDINDLFPLDASNGTATNLPIDYPFLNGDPGFGLFGLGFTGLMANGTDYLSLYDKEHPNLIMGGAVGLASAPATAGDPVSNTQEYAFHFGVNVTTATDVFTVQSKLLGDPFFDGLPVNQLQDQSQGIYIGTGDQDNYVSLSVDGNNGTPGIRVTHESGGVVQSSNILPVTDLLAEGEITMFLTVVPSTGLVRAGYNTLSDSEVKALDAVDISGSFLAALQGADAIAVGLMATSDVAPDFSATWDFMKLTFDEIVTGVDDPDETDRIDLYPNPATSEFTLRFNLESSENISVFLYDQLGQVLYLGQNALDQGVSTLEYNLDERGISQGIYYLKVATAKNPKVFKLIISE